MPAVHGDQVVDSRGKEGGGSEDKEVGISGDGEADDPRDDGGNISSGKDDEREPAHGPGHFFLITRSCLWLLLCHYWLYDISGHPTSLSRQVLLKIELVYLRLKEKVL
jgi:hypothetical protein